MSAQIPIIKNIIALQRGFVNSILSLVDIVVKINYAFVSILVERVAFYKDFTRCLVHNGGNKPPIPNQ
ncbi:MAG: hypothetical protein DSM106950_03945 [Stigonema ocellatum SAG 48.90 = DSM 106950]|nr:hypothetical protein [Stigonema ocellatum SAG 48.90 = DSM 106950]